MQSRPPLLLPLRRRLARWLLAGEALYEEAPGEAEAAAKRARIEFDLRRAAAVLDTRLGGLVEEVSRFRALADALAGPHRGDPRGDQTCR